MNKLEKWLFPKFKSHKFENRFTWGELYLSSNSKLGFYFTRSSIFEKDLFIFEIPFFFRLYISRPKPEIHRTVCDFYDKQEAMWGFYFMESQLVIGYGKAIQKKIKHIDMPWSYRWSKKEVLDSNRKVIWKETRKQKEKYKKQHGEILDTYEQRTKAEESVSQKFPYTYILENGTIQVRPATVHIDRMTWRMKWFPFIKKIRTCINVAFGDEVGEKTGSWKGGCTGCGYNMKRKETMEQCLRRMEKERKFN